MRIPLDSATPLLGYNNNIPYKGQVFHVQTEDSGSKHPHVITHLFADGGRVVSTTKTSYEHLLGGDNLSEKVRAMMRDQHKQMVIDLRDGEFDETLGMEEGAAGDGMSDAASAPLQAEAMVDLVEAPPAGPFPSTPPSEPIELLDGVPAPADVPTSPPVPAPVIPDATQSPSKVPPPPTDGSPGTYSFVGSRSTPPPQAVAPPGTGAGGPVSQPPRRPVPMAQPQRRIRPSSPTPSEAPPPAIERIGPRRSSPPASRPPPSDDRPTSVFQRGSSRSHVTVPDSSVAAQHAVHVFGERHVTERRFDDVVAAFLRRGG